MDEDFLAANLNIKKFIIMETLLYLGLDYCSQFRFSTEENQISKLNFQIGFLKKDQKD